ncbi:hypothetical protein B0H11DRAFT_2243088 [Mycena galericulata]|nr:hypothetical protein B0H11DRAFT_2243088 [Mycena galericulata]
MWQRQRRYPPSFSYLSCTFERHCPALTLGNAAPLLATLPRPIALLPFCRRLRKILNVKPRQGSSHRLRLLGGASARLERSTICVLHPPPSFRSGDREFGAGTLISPFSARVSILVLSAYECHRSGEGLSALGVSRVALALGGRTRPYELLSSAYSAGVRVVKRLPRRSYDLRIDPFAPPRSSSLAHAARVMRRLLRRSYCSSIDVRPPSILAAAFARLNVDGTPCHLCHADLCAGGLWDGCLDSRLARAVFPWQSFCTATMLMYSCASLPGLAEFCDVGGLTPRSRTLRDWGAVCLRARDPRAQSPVLGSAAPPLAILPPECLRPSLMQAAVFVVSTNVSAPISEAPHGDPAAHRPPEFGLGLGPEYGLLLYCEVRACFVTRTHLTAGGPSSRTEYPASRTPRPYLRLRWLSDASVLVAFLCSRLRFPSLAVVQRRSYSAILLSIFSGLCSDAPPTAILRPEDTLCHFHARLWMSI